jgi:hypothetical protein
MCWQLIAKLSMPVVRIPINARAYRPKLSSGWSISLAMSEWASCEIRLKVYFELMKVKLLRLRECKKSWTQT